MGYAYKDYYKKKRAENKKLIMEDEDNKFNQKYTEEEDEYIIQNLYRIKARDIGYALGRTELSINIRVKDFKKEWKDRFLQGR